MNRHYGDLRDRMTVLQVQEHGRLVARVRKMLERVERRGTDAAYGAVFRAVAELVEMEDRVVNPTAPSAATAANVADRLKLMTPGAGIVVPEREVLPAGRLILPAGVR